MFARSSLLPVLGFALSMALSAVPAAAQLISGAVVGTVADPSGSVIAGVKVTLESEVDRQQPDDDDGIRR